MTFPSSSNASYPNGSCPIAPSAHGAPDPVVHPLVQRPSGECLATCIWEGASEQPRPGMLEIAVVKLPEKKQKITGSLHLRFKVMLRGDSMKRKYNSSHIISSTRMETVLDCYIAINFRNTHTHTHSPKITDCRLHVTNKNRQPKTMARNPCRLRSPCDAFFSVVSLGSPVLIRLPPDFFHQLGQLLQIWDRASPVRFRGCVEGFLFVWTSRWWVDELKTNYPPWNNIAPENRPSQKGSSLPTIHFQGRTVSFRECIHF